jgi:hypothetical protein
LNPSWTRSTKSFWPFQTWSQTKVLIIDFTYYGVTRIGTGTFVARFKHPEDIPTGQASHIELDGNRVMYLNPRKYRLMGVLYHIPPNVDRIDVNGISKSTEFDIRDEQIDIEIPWNQKFRSEFASGVRMSAYALLAIPTGVTGEQFDTLRSRGYWGAYT